MYLRTLPRRTGAAKASPGTANRTPTPWALIPQGGGDPYHGHRCAGSANHGICGRRTKEGFF